MSFVVTRANKQLDEADVRVAIAQEGLVPHLWSNAPGDIYGTHEHQHHKVLYCLGGTITFEFADGTAVSLAPGDRLDIEPATPHAAAVGDMGVTCIEAARP